MLRIITSTGTQRAKDYFTESLDRGDYYTEGQELAGRWGGKAAEELGLTGEVDRESFFRMCENRRPDTGESLTLRTKDNRRVGYDLNFHAPKSVSIRYGLHDDEAIIEAFEKAIEETMRDIESDTQTRVRKEGAQEDRTTGNLCWASFTHLTARPMEDGIPDVHLHCHSYTFNCTYDKQEEAWKAIQFGNIKKDAGYYEASFHNRFRRGLEYAGFRTEDKGRYFELSSVQDPTIAKFSRRTSEIEKLAKEKGIVDPDRKSELGARTRKEKAKSLTMPQLTTKWDERLNPDERKQIEGLKKKPWSKQKVEAASRSHAKKAIAFATEHGFERESVLAEKKLLETATRYAGPVTTPEDLRSELAKQQLVTKEVNGRRLVTTKELIKEEEAMLTFARTGIGEFQPLARDYSDRSDSLNEDQQQAYAGILDSRDRVTVLRGGAGTGKTYMMTAVSEEIVRNKKELFAFAPSSQTAHDVLKKDGFKKADTTAMLLANPALQAKLKNNVMWVDEAGQLGTKSIGQLFKVAKKQNARVILTGDYKQHGSVERGGPFRLLAQEAGVTSLQLQKILRQRGDYKEVVKKLSNGQTTLGFNRMDELGYVKEMKQQEAHKQIATTYRLAKFDRQSALVVAPTHKEKDKLNSEIRKELRTAKLLRGKDKSLSTLRSLYLTEAEKKEKINYTRGQVICFHKATRGFRAGERTEVLGTDPFGNVMVRGIERPKATKRKAQAKVVGKHTDVVLPKLKTAIQYKLDKKTKPKDKVLPTALKLSHADRFDVFERKDQVFAQGDELRITRNGKTSDGKHSLRNGATYEVAGFQKLTGNIKLSNGWTIAQEFGHIAPAYAITSHASQGKTVDHVLIAQSAESFGASNREQFYVSVSRARRSVRVFTDDKQGLAKRIAKDNKTPDAITVKKDNDRAGKQMNQVRTHIQRQEPQKPKQNYER